MNIASPCSLYLQRLAPSGRRSMKSQLTQIQKIMKWEGLTEDQPFHKLNYPEIEYIKRYLIENNKSPRTINHAINALKGVIKTGFLMGETNEKKWLQVQAVTPLKTNASTRGVALTGDSVKELLRCSALDKRKIGIRDTAILAIFLATGLRRFELSNLTFENYDAKLKSLQVDFGKGKKSRRQYLPTWSIPYLNKWLALRGDSSGYLFNPFYSRHTQPQNQISTAAIYQIVTSRTKVALLKSSAPHDLRRSFITQLLVQNIDLSTASKLAGHASLATTQIYDKRGEDVTRAAALSLKF